jgi:hypothetical protein
VPVRAEIGLQGPFEQVDPVPQQRQAVTVFQVRDRHAQERTERQGWIWQQQLTTFDHFVHADPAHSHLRQR